ncbi:MAG TPA: hypothetical protein VGJ09_07080 [Bryobacteraceae bacterium]
MDPWRGLLDIGDYMKGGVAFISQAQGAIRVIATLVGMLSPYKNTPMGKQAWDELAEASQDADLLVAQLKDGIGTPHSQEDAEHFQSRLSFLIDRINAARQFMDEAVPVAARAARKETAPEEMA